MATSVIIRKYQENDRAGCRSLWRELTEWHREIYQDPKIGGEHPEDYFDKHLAKVGPEQLWVATRGSECVGLVGLILEGNEAEIEPLIVSKAHRGKGLGRRLIETAISKAKKRGVRLLNIKPVARNVETIKFLYRQGFKNLGHIDCSWTFRVILGKEGPEFSIVNSTFDVTARLTAREGCLFHRIFTYL